MEVFLNQSDDTFFWGDYPLENDRRFRDIEGARCFLVSILYDIPEGEWRISLELWDWEWGGVHDEVGIFVLSSPDPLVILGLISGMIVAFVGATVVAVKKWPMSKKM
jgi:hypothetical protein